ncbi:MULTISPECIES: hypothetical protein [unclassified Pseudomonas]|uniref:hypothetical protein n=1 Tax=unclassified Pseudomonas TaxID=196821 RepID=UPI001EE0547A|nr:MULTISPECIES: hypothetical protein [unclassified Pseudomonas]MCG4453938.1 hypothetical protein [Pseudomonas sp. MMS21 TM103]
MVAHTDESIAAIGGLERFDIFVLGDTGAADIAEQNPRPAQAPAETSTAAW